MEHFNNEFTTIFYLTDAANSGKIVICVLTEHTDVFILLECKMLMERWHITTATVSAVAWHACPQQLRHDFIYTRQRQVQCAKHLAH